jgi:hypothetical protein
MDRGCQPQLEVGPHHRQAHCCTGITVTTEQSSHRTPGEHPRHGADNMRAGDHTARQSSGASTVPRPSRISCHLSCRTQPGTDGSNPASSSRQSVSRPRPLSRVENPGLPRGCARLAGQPGRQRRAGCFDFAPTGGNISVEPYSSTAVPLTACENATPIGNKVGPVPGVMVR